MVSLEQLIIDLLEPLIHLQVVLYVGNGRVAQHIVIVFIHHGAVSLEQLIIDLQETLAHQEVAQYMVHGKVEQHIMIIV